MHIWSEIPEDELEVTYDENLIGSGPFKFESASRATDNWRLTRYEDYHGDKPYLDAIVFVYYSNIDTMTQALKLGEIDGFFQSNASQLATLRADPNIDAVSAKLPGFSHIGLNIYEEGTGNPLLQDINIRYALEHALDREKIVDMVFFGCAEIGSSLLSEAGGWHYPVPEEDYRSYDLAKANALLDAAGYTERNAAGTRLDADGNPLEFNIIYSSDEPTRQKMASFLAEGCNEIGIKINGSILDSNAIADAIAEYSYDMFIWGWYEEVDPTPMLNIYTIDEIFYNNETGFMSEAYDELFWAQEEILDDDERLLVVQEMQAMAYAECPNIIIVYDEEIQAIRKDRWKDYVKVRPDIGPWFMNNTFLTYMNIKPVE
jgi:peptide/nickel transport system substrate-binding protein